MMSALNTKARAIKAILGLGLATTVAACGGSYADVAVRGGPQAVHPSASALSQRSLVAAPAAVVAPAPVVTAPVGAAPVMASVAPVATASVMVNGPCYDGFGGTNCGVPGDVYTGAQPIVD